MTKHRHVLGLHEIDETQIAIVGGKGAHLAALSRIEGVRVPPGFVVTTHAFEQWMAEGGTAVPDDVAAAITRALAVVGPVEGRALAGGEHAAYAVRSSATTEDSAAASFAGQHDTYLNVVGAASIIEHVRRCWASLFTERAVTYRLRNGFEERKVQMAVVVQQMVFPRAAGVLFTADPVTGNRKITSIDASFGLGEALVSGLVNADVFKVRGDEVVARVIATKELAIVAAPEGGTRKHAIDRLRQKQASLTDAQAVRLAQIGRRIEAHFGCPQDIEWCAVGAAHGGAAHGGAAHGGAAHGGAAHDGGDRNDGDDTFHIVQSRPITTLFPIPAAADGANHVYVSVGHQQMMTDPIKPLGLSVWQLTTRRPMAEAGGRLFVDVTALLASPASRANVLDALGKSDPLIRDALQTILDRGDFIRPLADEGTAWAPPGGATSTSAPTPIPTDPAIPADLIARSQESIATLKRDIAAKSGSALLDFIVADIDELRRTLFDPRGLQMIVAAMDASFWLNEQLQAWLGEKNAADTLTQSVPHNVTSEMGLALLEVADAIRPHPQVVTFLEQVADDDFLAVLPALAGGQEARDAIQGYLEAYGMRCAGEIDITRPRWSERPTTIVPALLGNMRNFEPGEGERRFGQGRLEAEKKEQDVLARLRALPDGEKKAEETKRMIERVRTFMGYREYPKYGMVSRYFVYKQALLKEAERLVDAHVLRAKEDIFYLRFEELQDLVRTNQVDYQLIEQRTNAYRSHERLTPPRVLTSDGEGVAGTYRRDDLPPGALVGLPVSAGTVEGRARVILDMAHAKLEAGDILVTAFTDPSWTPLFVGIKGLVTEVGGVMTHGAVIAREYGLPAVVGVANATRLIRDGQRIRVHGTDGYVEIASEEKRTAGQ